ncbi:hypothetical protein ACJIZ3_019923 [Penstemon smallii]|uniref:Uncharacterized protein n=1 Tax=Penstemon smallii TaxID=265156 RepID=A0ABD3T3B9_9LAMI
MKNGPIIVTSESKTMRRHSLRVEGVRKISLRIMVSKEGDGVAELGGDGLGKGGLGSCARKQGGGAVLSGRGGGAGGRKKKRSAAGEDMENEEEF